MQKKILSFAHNNMKYILALLIFILLILIFKNRLFVVEGISQQEQHSKKRNRRMEAEAEPESEVAVHALGRPGMTAVFSEYSLGDKADDFGKQFVLTPFTGVTPVF